LMIQGMRMPVGKREKIEAEIELEVRTAFDQAINDPWPEKIY
jgi:hypothetical protein